MTEKKRHQPWAIDTLPITYNSYEAAQIGTLKRSDGEFAVCGRRGAGRDYVDTVPESFAAKAHDLSFIIFNNQGQLVAEANGGMYTTPSERRYYSYIISNLTANGPRDFDHIPVEPRAKRLIGDLTPYLLRNDMITAWISDQNPKLVSLQAQAMYARLDSQQEAQGIILTHTPENQCIITKR